MEGKQMGKVKKDNVREKRENKKIKIGRGKRVILTNGDAGITLIALGITIVILLILARNYNWLTNRRKWTDKKCSRCERPNGN